MSRIGIVVLGHASVIEREKLSEISFDDVTDFRADTQNLGLENIVQRAESRIRSHLDQGHSMLIVTSGSKIRYTDSLSIGDVLMREIVRSISLRTFAGSKAKIQVEDSSKDVNGAVKYISNLFLKHNIDRICLITHDNSTHECLNAFQEAMPRFPVEILQAAG